MMLPLLLLLAGMPSALLPADALRHVNDSRYGGRGSDLIPLLPTTVHLRSAEVTLTEVLEKDGWQVSARYDLENPGAAPVAVSLLLPEDRCATGGACSPMAGAFIDLGLRFGDQLVEPMPAPADAVRPFTHPSDPPGRGYLYRITAPSRQSRHLSLEYRFDQSRGTMYRGVHYLSSAGRWGGAVQRVRYVVELKQPMPYVIYPRAYKLAEFAEHGSEHGAGSTISLVFTAEGQTGRSDFVAIFPEDALSGRTPAGECEGFRGDKSDDELLPIVRRYGADLLHACRDLVMALHGYPFKDPALRARYYGPPPALPPWADAQSFAIAGRPENHAYRESLLGPGEQAYLRMLGEMERRRKK